jgi:transcriptional regulator with XRE-family HTH domain
VKFAEAQARAGLTDRELSKKAGKVSTRTIWRIKNPDEEVAPRRSTMRKLAEAMNVSVEDIDEFAEAIWRRTMKQARKEGAPEDALDMADTEREVFHVPSTDMGFIESMNLRFLRESIEFLVRRGRGKDVDKVYREARGHKEEDR